LYSYIINIRVTISIMGYISKITRGLIQVKILPSGRWVLIRILDDVKCQKHRTREVLKIRNKVFRNVRKVDHA
jgi:hypothetical protein